MTLQTLATLAVVSPSQAPTAVVPPVDCVSSLQHYILLGCASLIAGCLSAAVSRCVYSRKLKNFRKRLGDIETQPKPFRDQSSSRSMHSTLNIHPEQDSSSGGGSNFSRTSSVANSRHDTNTSTRTAESNFRFSRSASTKAPPTPENQMPAPGNAPSRAASFRSNFLGPGDNQSTRGRGVQRSLSQASRHSRSQPDDNLSVGNYTAAYYTGAPPAPSSNRPSVSNSYAPSQNGSSLSRVQSFQSTAPRQLPQTREDTFDDTSIIYDDNELAEDGVAEFYDDTIQASKAPAALGDDLYCNHDVDGCWGDQKSIRGTITDAELDIEWD